jgi:hypothetical protein
MQKAEFNPTEYTYLRILREFAKEGLASMEKIVASMKSNKIQLKSVDLELIRAEYIGTDLEFDDLFGCGIGN